MKLKPSSKGIKSVSFKKRRRVSKVIHRDKHLTNMRNCESRGVHKAVVQNDVNEK
jgi:hypothetical protein